MHTRCWPSGLDGASEERRMRSEWEREPGFWANPTPGPVQRAFMRPGCCPSQQSNSKFHRGLWTGWQRAAAARRAKPHSATSVFSHTHVHIHTRTWKDAACSQMHTLSQQAYLSWRESWERLFWDEGKKINWTNKQIFRSRLQPGWHEDRRMTKPFIVAFWLKDLVLHEAPRPVGLKGVDYRCAFMCRPSHPDYQPCYVWLHTDIPDVQCFYLFSEATCNQGMSGSCRTLTFNGNWQVGTLNQVKGCVQILEMGRFWIDFTLDFELYYHNCLLEPYYTHVAQIWAKILRG